MTSGERCWRTQLIDRAADQRMRKLAQIRAARDRDQHAARHGPGREREFLDRLLRVTMRELEALPRFDQRRECARIENFES